MADDLTTFFFKPEEAFRCDVFAISAIECGRSSVQKEVELFSASHAFAVNVTVIIVLLFVLNKNKKIHLGNSSQFSLFTRVGH